VVFSLRFLHQILYALLLFPMRATRPAHLSCRDLITKITQLSRSKKPRRSSLRNFLQYTYLGPLRPKYLPQHPTLNTLSLFFPQNVRPILRPYQALVFITFLYILKAARQEIPDRMLAGFTGLVSVRTFFLKAILF
jgi:hypothetical protein